MATLVIHEMIRYSRSLLAIIAQNIRHARSKLLRHLMSGHLLIDAFVQRCGVIQSLAADGTGERGANILLEARFVHTVTAHSKHNWLSGCKHRTAYMTLTRV